MRGSTLGGDLWAAAARTRWGHQHLPRATVVPLSLCGVLLHCFISVYLAALSDVWSSSFWFRSFRDGGCSSLQTATPEAGLGRRCRACYLNVANVACVIAAEAHRGMLRIGGVWMDEWMEGWAEVGCISQGVGYLIEREGQLHSLSESRRPLLLLPGINRKTEQLQGCRDKKTHDCRPDNI